MPETMQGTQKNTCACGKNFASPHELEKHRETCSMAKSQGQHPSGQMKK